MGRSIEHSPWIAEAIFDFRPDGGSSDGRGTCRRRWRRWSRPRHPIGGSLCCAPIPIWRAVSRSGEMFTPQSAAEQAGAGLGDCSPAEFQRFTALNEAYKAKFGFPFIMAVKGRSRAEILAAFERRVGNDAAVDSEPPSTRCTRSRCCGYAICEPRSRLQQADTEETPGSGVRGDWLPGAASQLTSTAGRKTLRRSRNALFSRIESLL